MLFRKTELPYLGHIETAEHNEAKPEHIRAVLEAGLPKNRHLRLAQRICAGPSLRCWKKSALPPEMN